MTWVTGTKDDSATALQSFDELKRFVATEYGSAAQIEDFTVYRRNDVAGSSARIN